MKIAVEACGKKASGAWESSKVRPMSQPTSMRPRSARMRRTALSSNRAARLSVGFDFLRRVGCAGALFACAISATARGPDIATSWFACDQSVCGFNVGDIPALPEPCASVGVLAAWLATSGAALVQCNADSGPAGDTMVLVFDRRDLRRSRPRLFEVVGGRFVKPSFLPEAAASGVPDRFGPVPLCRQPIPADAERTPLVVLVKVPAADSAAGACYRVLYVATGKQGLSMRPDDGSAAPAAADAQAQTRWAPLLSRLRPLMPH